MGSKRRARITFLESTKKLQSWQTHCSYREDGKTGGKERTVLHALGMEIGHMAKREKEAQNVRKSTGGPSVASERKDRRY